MYLWKSQSRCAGIYSYNNFKEASLITKGRLQCSGYRGLSSMQKYTTFWPSSLQMLQNCNRACYLIPATTIWSPFLLFMLLRRPSGIFRNINLLFLEKYLWDYAKKYSTNLADAICEDTLQPLNEVTALKPITSHFFSHHHDFSTSQSIPFNKDLKTLETTRHTLPAVCLKSFPISHCSFHFILLLSFLMASWHPVS